MRAILIALLLIAVGGVSAHAECVTKDKVAQGILAEVPDSAVRLITGPDAAALAAGIAELAGAQVAPNSEFLVAEVEGGQLSYVVQFEQGCATHHGRFLTKVVEALIAGRAS